MNKTSFRPCSSCAIPSITTCNVGGCMQDKGKAYKGSITAIEKEKIKADFEQNGCPYNN